MFTFTPSRFIKSVQLNRMGKGVAGFGLTALLAFTAATAQVAPLDSSGLDSSGNAKSEMATCNSGSTQQDRAACATEVRNANAEKSAGKLGASSELTANAMKRCDAFKPGEDQAACRARVESQATLEGSVGSGGVLRQTETTIPAAAK